MLKKEQDVRESMYLVNEFANNYFKEVMHETDQGKSIGLSYFKNGDLQIILLINLI